MYFTGEVCSFRSACKKVRATQNVRCVLHLKSAGILYVAPAFQKWNMMKPFKNSSPPKLHIPASSASILGERRGCIDLVAWVTSLLTGLAASRVTSPSVLKKKPKKTSERLPFPESAPGDCELPTAWRQCRNNAKTSLLGTWSTLHFIHQLTKEKKKKLEY